MCQNHTMASLGFTDEKVPVGSHICQIFNDHDERINTILKYLLSGLQTGERTACFSNAIDEEGLREFFSSHNISYDERKQNKEIALTGTDEVYFQNNVFDPDIMLKAFSNYYQESLDLGFPASRVVGEMSPKVNDLSGGDRLIEYEVKVTQLLIDHPITAMCQYDANEFSGATIMEVLKVHPQMIVNGSVIHNPFYITPEEFLQTIQ